MILNKNGIVFLGIFENIYLGNKCDQIELFQWSPETHEAPFYAELPGVKSKKFLLTRLRYIFVEKLGKLFNIFYFIFSIKETKDSYFFTWFTDFYFRGYLSLNC